MSLLIKASPSIITQINNIETDITNIETDITNIDSNISVHDDRLTIIEETFFTIEGKAGDAISAFSVCAKYGDDEKVYLAKASSDYDYLAKSMLVISLVDVADQALATFYRAHIIGPTAVDLIGDPGQPAYLSEDELGAVKCDPPVVSGSYARIVGYYLDTRHWLFFPENDWIVLA